MNNNKNIKISYNNKAAIEELQNKNKLNMDASQLVPAYTHTMNINVVDENDNIIPTTVNLKFFFTNQNPDNAPIYAEFTKVDSSNNIVYSKNFSCNGVDEVGLPMAAAILGSVRSGNNPTNEIDNKSSSDSEDNTQNKPIHNTIIYRHVIERSKTKDYIKKILDEHFPIEKYKQFKNFQEIFADVSKICSSQERLGVVTGYDIACDICRYYNIVIDNLYLITNDVKSAASNLELPKSLIKSKKIGNFSVKYIPIDEFKQFFSEKDVEIPFESSNGYHYEMFLSEFKKKKEKKEKTK